MRSIFLMCSAALLGAASQGQTWVHVNVFDGTRLLRNRTVVLEEGVIKELGRAKVKGAIEGKGKTLLPVLIDAAAARGEWVQLDYDDGFAWGTRRPQASYEALHDEVERVHQEHKRALVEVGSLRESMEALNAEADGLLKIYAGAQGDAAFVKLAARRKVFVVPMLAPLMAASSKTGKPRHEGSLAAVRQLRKAHIPLLVGGPDLVAEMESLVREIGLTPVEALRAATSVAARVLGLADQGVIAKGQRVPVMLVEGDPTLTVGALRKRVN